MAVARQTRYLCCMRSALFLAVTLAAGAVLVAADHPMQNLDPSDVFQSLHAEHDFDLTADPRAPMWSAVAPVLINRTYDGRTHSTQPTEVRSRWTTTHLYLSYVCPYDTLTLKPNPDLSAETPQLWNWDVAEAFIGSDFERIGFYKEFQVSPQGEWVDLAIDRDNPGTQEGMRWNSGFEVKARIDVAAKKWYGEMRIPFAAIDTSPAHQGREYRIGLFRISGASPRVLHLWRPTGAPNFHVPQAFGRLMLVAK